MIMMVARHTLLLDILKNKSFFTVSPSDPIRTAACLLPKTHSSAVAVLDDKELVGILTAQDIVEKVVGLHRDIDNTPVRKIMRPDPVTIPSNSSIYHALDMMTQTGYRAMPVMDEARYVGMLDIRDLYAGICNVLEKRLKADESLISYCFGEPYGRGYEDVA